MEKNIYIIEFFDKGEHYNKYAQTLGVAEQYLLDRGYQVTQLLNKDQNEAGVYEFEGDAFFAPQMARIISRTLLD